MTTNPNSPFGFRKVTRRDSVSTNYGTRSGLIASANTNKIFRGDVLKPYSAGYLDVFTAPVGGGAAIGGIAWAFEWVSISQGKTVRQNWWPGNGDASGDVTVLYDADPGDLFEVQSLLSAITQASVGLNANFAVGGGGRQTGAGNDSSFSLDQGTLDVGASLPFKVYRLPVEGPQASQYSMAGYDASQNYNRVWVTINNLTA